MNNSMNWMKFAVFLAALGSSTPDMTTPDIHLDPQIKNRG